MGNSWQKLGVVFGGLGVLTAILAFATPEVRCFFNLQSEACPSKAPVSQNSGQLNTPAQSEADFAGKWQSDPSYYSGFILTLEQNGNQITGYHSAVSQEGNRIDASIPNEDRPTIYGRVNGNVAKVTFNSSYGNGRGDATLLLEGSKLTWVITRDNGGEHFLPKEAPMYKVN